MDLSKGIPKGRPSKKMPKPFRRPSVSITRGPRKEWQWVAATDITAGDLVASHGLVHEARLEISDTAHEAVVWIRAGESQGPVPFAASQVLNVFREVEVVPDGD